MDTSNIWQAVLSDLELQVSRAVFKTFLANTTLLSLQDGKATIGCENPLLIHFIEKRYQHLIKTVLVHYTKNDTALVFVPHTKKVSSRLDAPLFQDIPSFSPEASPQIHTRYAPRQEEPISFSFPLAFNPDYRFDTFAVSSSNQMAYAAATAVAKSPGTSYSPLFLYGGVGVGKTHLMQSIARSIVEKNPHVRVGACTGEEFTNEIIDAISKKTTGAFKKKYRKLNLLLIDDIQFIAGKYSIQEEFFHTFNAIQQVKGQIVLTSDRPPEDIEKLEERLRSRFEGGLTIDISPPDFELRTAILLIKAKQRNIPLSIDLAKLIALEAENPRKLEGLLIRIWTEVQTKHIPFDEHAIQAVVGKSGQESRQITPIDPQRIIQTVASYFHITPTQLKGTKRDKPIAIPRQILYYVLNIDFHIPLVQIGALLGGRDHTTILFGVRKITQLLSTDEKLRGDIVGIKNRIFG